MALKKGPKSITIEHDTSVNDPNEIPVMVNEEMVGVVADVEAHVLAPLLAKGKIRLDNARADGWASVKCTVVEARPNKTELSLRVQDKLLDLDSFN